MINLNTIILKICLLIKIKSNSDSFQKNDLNRNNLVFINSSFFLKKMILKSKFFQPTDILNYNFFKKLYNLNCNFLETFQRSLIIFNNNQNSYLFKKKNVLLKFIYLFYYKNKLFFFKNFEKFFTKSFKKTNYKSNKILKFIKIKKKNKKKLFFVDNFLPNLLKFNSVRKFKKKNNLVLLKSSYNSYENVFFSKIQNSRNFFFKFLNVPKKNTIDLYMYFGKNKIKKLYKIEKTVFKKITNFNLLDLFLSVHYYKKMFKFKTNNTNNYILKNFITKPSFKFFIFSSKFNFILIFIKLSILKIKKIKLNKPNTKNNFNKKPKLNRQLNEYLVNAFKNIVYFNDFYNNFFLKNTNKFLLKSLYNSNLFLKSSKNLKEIQVNRGSFQNIFISRDSEFLYYNNYYPIFFSPTKSKNRFLSKFKFNSNINYLVYMQFYIIGFLENLFKKKILLKVTNNFFKKPGHLNELLRVQNDNKNYQPKFLKNFILKDFINILWYSFFFRDLTLLSNWICKFFENTHFKVHRKFILFFQNFINKYNNIFVDIMRIKGFFFDIRGKVGVTGNSKKRHFFFKIGKLNKSTKFRKINFNQSAVRTPSGALGLTLIINY